MRTAFVKTLIECARKDSRIILLTGDLGFMALEPFIKAFPKRYINAGVAEANMIGMAAGLASAGKKVFVYSIIPFVTMRCLEQIRNDVCYHNFDVKIVGVGSGYSYSYLGATHHAIEDMGALRSLPNLRIVSPGDPLEVELSVRTLVKEKGPFYLRLGKRGEPVLQKKMPKFKWGQAIIMKNGKDASLLSSGSVLINALKASEELEKEGLKVTLVSMPFIKPIDSATVKNLAKKTKVVVTIEEHNIIGGLGSAVAEIIAGSPHKPAFMRLGVDDYFVSKIGSQEYLKEKAGLSVGNIVKTVKNLLRK